MLSEHDLVAQIQLRDGSIARHFIIKGGKVSSRAGPHARPVVVMSFKDVATALAMMKPRPDMGEVVHAAKNFKVIVMGPDPLCVWFMQLLNAMNSAGLQRGTPMPDGTTRCTMVTNGGPLFVYVKDGRIIRTTPIDFDDRDGASWTLKVRGRGLAQRQATVAPHALTMKSTVYSDKRILYPMKRVDYDPSGNRNVQNRGISGYEKISWEEALDIVAAEIRRQKQVHGPGSIVIPTSSHHQWGNVGYYLSALLRFGNLIGFTRMATNPDSWEGWYWGALTPLGSQPAHRHSRKLRHPYEVAFKEAELMVFWSSDPGEYQWRVHGIKKSTQRRLWARGNFWA